MDTMKTTDRSAREGKTELPRPADAVNRLPHSHISLKEWNTLLAVVRNDGFARAAEVLHLSQPAISYTIAKIEERLGISILRPEGRRARITPVGELLLAHVEPLIQMAVQVEAIARQLRASWRPEIRLAVVDDFPTRLLIAALRSHAGQQAGATVLLTEGTPDAVQQLLHKRDAELAITRQLGSGMTGEILVETEYLAVAHPGHALFRHEGPLSDADLRQAIEVTIEAGDAHPGQAGPQRWHVGNHETAEQALAEGIGYGWLPGHQAQEALAAGRLAPLPLASYPPRVSRFYLAHLASRPLSEEGSQLAVILRSAIGASAGARIDARIDAQSGQR
jgi:DNA-binding transcriptional LysR family regulator